MNWIWTAPSGWLVRSVLGGGLLLLLTWVLIKRTRQPARRQRLGEWGVVAALVLAVLSLTPTWLHIPWLPARTLARNESTARQDAGLQPAAKQFESAPKQQPPSPPLASDNPRKERGASFHPLRAESPWRFDPEEPLITSEDEESIGEDQRSGRELAGGSFLTNEEPSRSRRPE